MVKKKTCRGIKKLNKKMSVNNPLYFNTTDPSFCIAGEACRLNLFLVDVVSNKSSRGLYPTLKIIGFNEREAMGLRVVNTLSQLAKNVRLMTENHDIETLYVYKKTGNILFHLKPDREFGLVTNHNDIRISKTHRVLRTFDERYYGYFPEDKPVFLLYDNDEFDIPEKNIPKIIAYAPGPVYVCTRKQNLSVYEGATAVIVSEDDFKAATSTVSNLIVTLGSEGASYNDKIYPVEKTFEGNNLGCREDFFALFSYAHYFTKDFDYSISIANRVASFDAKFKDVPKYAGTGLTELLLQLKKEILQYNK